MHVRPLALGLITVLAGSATVVSTHSPASASTVYGPTRGMVFTTANIGRGYPDNSVVWDAMRRIRNNLNDVSDGHPRFLGFQEIDEGNDIGDTANEMYILKHVYRYDHGWRRTIYRNNDSDLPLRVPEVAHDAQKSYHRIVYGSASLKKASPTRWITVTRYANQNISLLNTHFMAKAWGTCTDRCAERKDRWNALWNHLESEVAQEYNAGYNVVVTADWNRNPGSTWSPADVHSGGRLVRNGGYDSIVAVPHQGWKVIKVKRADGTYKQGSWKIGIDPHRAQWVEIRFARK